jgi:hypothetical protein
MQKLRLVGDAAGNLGAARETETQHGNGRRRKAEAQKRILEMVAKQEKVAAQPCAF